MSCNVCQPPSTTQSTTISTTSTAPETSLDNNESCASWAATGECQANPDYMLSECKKSCNICQQVSTIPSANNQTSSTAPTASTASTVLSLHPTLPPKTTEATTELSTAIGIRINFICMFFSILNFLYI